MTDETKAAPAIVCASCGADQDPADTARCAECGSTSFAEKAAPSAPAAPTRGKLPDDFPGVAALTDAGFGTYGKVRRIAAADELVAIPGIGEATAQKIKDALGLKTDESDEDAE